MRKERGEKYSPLSFCKGYGMDNRELMRNREERVSDDRRRKQVRRQILLLICCVCTIIVFEIVAFLVLGRENREEIPDSIKFDIAEETDGMSGNGSREEPANRLEWLLVQAEKTDTGSYTDETVKILKQRCEEARIILNDENSVQDDMEMAGINLMLAMQQLEIR